MFYTPLLLNPVISHKPCQISTEFGRGCRGTVQRPWPQLRRGDRSLLDVFRVKTRAERCRAYEEMGGGVAESWTFSAGARGVQKFWIPGPWLRRVNENRDTIVARGFWRLPSRHHETGPEKARSGKIQGVFLTPTRKKLKKKPRGVFQPRTVNNL